MNSGKATQSTSEQSPSILRTKLPLAIAATAPISMLFGATAYNTNWSLDQILLIGLLGFSGSGQFAALPLAESGTSFLTLVVVTSLINSRYFVIALSCSTKLPHNTLYRIFTSHTLGDEAYAIEQGQTQNTMLVIRFTIFLSWILFGVLGGIIVQQAPYLLPDHTNISFPASIVLFFLAVSQLKDRAKTKGSLITLPKILLGLMISSLCYFSFGPVYFWLPAIALLAVGYYFSGNSNGK